MSGVPKTIVNDRIEILGALPEEMFVPQALASQNEEMEMQDVDQTKVDGS